MERCPKRDVAGGLAEGGGAGVRAVGRAGRVAAHGQQERGRAAVPVARRRAGRRPGRPHRRAELLHRPRPPLGMRRHALQERLLLVSILLAIRYCS